MGEKLKKKSPKFACCSSNKTSLRGCFVISNMCTNSGRYRHNHGEEVVKTSPKEGSTWGLKNTYTQLIIYGLGYVQVVPTKPKPYSHHTETTVNKNPIKYSTNFSFAHFHTPNNKD